MSISGKSIMRAWSFALILLAITLSGCASKLMSPAVDSSQSVTSDDTRIVFFRTSSFGGMVQAPVAEYVNGSVKPVGILSTGTKVRYIVPAGQHDFVVGGESSNILRANVAPQKYYYVRVEPRMGFIKARFKLVPITAEDLKQVKLQKSIMNAKMMSLNSSGDKWFATHKDDMLTKYNDALADFNKLSPEKQKEYTLDTADGVDTFF